MLARSILAGSPQSVQYKSLFRDIEKQAISLKTRIEVQGIQKASFCVNLEQRRFKLTQGVLISQSVSQSVTQICLEL